MIITIMCVLRIILSTEAPDPKHNKHLHMYTIDYDYGDNWYYIYILKLEFQNKSIGNTIAILVCSY